MTPLLTYAQQQQIKKISANNERHYDPIEKETEEFELRKLTGVALLQDLQKNPTKATNVTLLDGGTFIDCNGNQVDFKGLRYVLAYMVYSRYIGTIPYKDTATGFVQKNRQEANSIDEGTTKRLQKENRQLALEEWLLTKEFLNENNSDYPLWNCGQSKKPYAPKFTPLRKTFR